MGLVGIRRHLTVVVLLLIAVTVIVTSAAGARATRAPRGLPRLITDTYKGIRPRTVAFTADGGNIVGDIRWAYWNHTRALGHGTSDIQGCVPNCAAGSETPYATTLRFSDPKHGHFTKVIEIRDHIRTVGHDGTDSWPEGATS